MERNIDSTTIASSVDSSLLSEAAEAISQADALLIGAGAGMSADSGVATYRWQQAIWQRTVIIDGKEHALRSLNMPKLFIERPEVAWGIYGERLLSYRSVEPHLGYFLLHEWARQKPDGYFVFTSNVDGLFQRAGFAEESIVEFHGSLHHLQCSKPCSGAIWSAQNMELAVDEERQQATLFPHCPRCGAAARPNVLMFGDGKYMRRRREEQKNRYHHWLYTLPGKKVVTIECGAGRAIPVVRWTCEDAMGRLQGALVRINPHETQKDFGHYVIPLPLGASEALQSLHAIMYPEQTQS